MVIRDQRVQLNHGLVVMKKRNDAFAGDLVRDRSDRRECCGFRHLLFTR